MPSVARNETSSCSNPKIDVFLRKSGVLTDMAVLEFQIFDVSTPAKQITPVQVFPTIIGTRQAVNLADCPVGQKISTGHYAALWTVPAAEPLGSHQIRWFFKETIGSVEGEFREEFEVTAVVGAGTGDLYVSVADMRALGITTAMVGDVELERLLRMCQQLFDRATRQWFNERTATVILDGTDADSLHLAVPIVSITSIEINNQGSALDPTLYKVYKGRENPDDRKNPRIKLIGPDESVDIFTAPQVFGRLKFRKGRQNQKIVGTFGYLEPDDSTPEPVKDAIKRMVVERLTHPIFLPPGGSPIPSPPSGGAGAIVEEWTDGHRLRYAAATLSERRSGLSGITSDPFVQDVIKLYKSPLGMATPAHWTYD